MEKKSYKIGSISIDADGVWWVHWAGTYLEEGDVVFGPRNTGGYNLDHALKIAGMNLRKCRELYVDQIQALERSEDVQEMVEAEREGEHGSPQGRGLEGSEGGPRSSPEVVE